MRVAKKVVNELYVNRVGSHSKYKSIIVCVFNDDAKMYGWVKQKNIQGKKSLR